MADRDRIISFCDELLSAGEFDDYGPNGLQVPGADEVATVVSGVSANLELLERGVEAGAEIILVHHGLFWGGRPQALSVPMASRLRTLLGAGCSLAAYHLPLDAHAEIGNNALLREALALDPDGRRFAEAKGTPIGVVGSAPGGIGVDELAGRLVALLGREPLVFDSGPKQIESVGIVTGGGSFAIAEAAGLGLDALVTGEPSEPSMGEAREHGIHFLAGGHHSTETLGVRRLGELIAERFSVEHRFVDVPNPV